MNPYFDQPILPPKEPYQGPVPDVRLTLRVESMAAQVAHYFSGYEDALQDAVTRACEAYLKSPTFEREIEKAVFEAVRRVIEQAADSALYNQGLREEIDKEVKKHLPKILDTALAHVRNR